MKLSKIYYLWTVDFDFFEQELEWDLGDNLDELFNLIFFAADYDLSLFVSDNKFYWLMLIVFDIKL